jgi:hypothetical protein
LAQHFLIDNSSKLHPTIVTGSGAKLLVASHSSRNRSSVQTKPHHQHSQAPAATMSQARAPKTFNAEEADNLEDVRPPRRLPDTQNPR